MEQFAAFVSKQPILFLLLGVIVGLIIWTEFRRFTRGYKEVTPAEVVQLINREDALVLDVREDAELNQGKIRGAKHIPLSVLKQRVEELDKFRETPVITYCRTGSRAAQASNILLKSQFQKVFNMKGGMAAWENADLPKVGK